MRAFEVVDFESDINFYNLKWWIQCGRSDLSNLMQLRLNTL